MTLAGVGIARWTRVRDSDIRTRAAVGGLTSPAGRTTRHGHGPGTRPAWRARSFRSMGDRRRFDRTFKTNVYSVFWITRTALPHLRNPEAGASIRV